MTSTNLLTSNPVYKPFRYPWAYEAWLTQQRIHWLPEEVPLADDVQDWQLNLSEGERNLLTQIFRFFTQADVEVNNCYMRHYAQVFKPTEVLMMLSAFSNIECFDENTELLTSAGWVPCPLITEAHAIAQYELASGTISFVKPDRVVSYDYNGTMHHYRSDSSDICVTPNHDLIVRHPISKATRKAKSFERKWGRNYLYPSSGYAVGNATVDPLWRLQIAIAADGCLIGACPSSSDTWRSVMINLTKDRKKDRLRGLLVECGVEFTETPINDQGAVRFRFRLPDGCDLATVKDLGFISLDGLAAGAAAALVEEVMAWDGSTAGRTPTFYSTNRAAIDKVQALCALAGISSVVSINRGAGSEARLPNGTTTTHTKTCWALTTSDKVWRTYPHREEVHYVGKVYCVSVQTQNLVSRRNGRVAITGNTVHIAAYSHLLDTIGMPEAEYQAFLKYQEMKDKYDYMQSFTVESKHEIAKTLAAFGAFTEGLQLFASFAILLNFPRHNKMKGMGQIVSWSVRDETLHCVSAIRLFHTFVQENPEIWTDALREEIYQVCRTIVEHEDAFIDLAFAMGPVDGLTAQETKNYIRFIADRRLTQMSMQPLYGIEQNPLPWLDDMLNAPEHANFFEARATEYAKASTLGTWEEAFA